MGKSSTNLMYLGILKCAIRIAHFKIPRYIKFVDDFPMTVSGKIQKYKMREDSIKELGLEEAAEMKTA